MDNLANPVGRSVLQIALSVSLFVSYAMVTKIPIDIIEESLKLSNKSNEEDNTEYSLLDSQENINANKVPSNKNKCKKAGAESCRVVIRTLMAVGTFLFGVEVPVFSYCLALVGVVSVVSGFVLPILFYHRIVGKNMIVPT